jgi:hypothetical protein
MEGDTFSKAEVIHYATRLGRGVRDRFDAAVGREAPLIAARLGVDERKLWRELRACVRGVEQELADRDAGTSSDETGDGAAEEERA